MIQADIKRSLLLTSTRGSMKIHINGVLLVCVRIGRPHLSSCPVQYSTPVVHSTVSFHGSTPANSYTLFPKNDTEDKRCWVFGFVSQEKECMSNLHSHPIHGASHLLSATKQSLVKPAQLNPTLTPLEVAQVSSRQ